MVRTSGLEEQLAGLDLGTGGGGSGLGQRTGGGGSSGGTVRVHMRTLGYMGSFLLQYTSAQVRACAATAASLPV